MDKKIVGTRMDKKLWQKIRLYCIKNGMTVEEFMEQAVTDKLSK